MSLLSAAQYTSFQSVTNPYEADLDGITFLGTSGQNIQNIRQYTRLNSGADIAEITLQSRHIAPTCPDTLGCYPYIDEDPFILRDCPHVYFCGNQKRFETKLVEGDQGQKTLVVCVPKFFDSHQVVLVNLKDLSCFPVSFATLLTPSTGDATHLDHTPEEDSGGEEDGEELPDVNVTPDADDDME
eukprot:sb/3471401/